MHHLHHGHLHVGVAAGSSGLVFHCHPVHRVNTQLTQTESLRRRKWHYVSRTSVEGSPPDVLSPLWWIGEKKARTHWASDPPSQGLVESPLEVEGEGPAPKDTPTDELPLSKENVNV